MSIMSENGNILTRPSGGILATDCGSGGCACSGADHPRASNCDANCSRLAAQFDITFSGIVGTANHQKFNGTHRATWMHDGYWEVVWDTYWRVYLQWSAGSWYAGGIIDTAGGFAFSFVGYEATDFCNGFDPADGYMCHPGQAERWDRASCSCMWCFPNPCNGTIVCSVSAVE